MYKRSGLITDRVGQNRVGVAQAAHRDAADRVEVAPPIRIEQPRAFATFERHRHPRVGVHQE